MLLMMWDVVVPWLRQWLSTRGNCN